jgi:type I restriction enzyme S subunit
MSLMRIDEIFRFEKGILQSSKCVPGDFDFITASSDWKTHNEYTHDCEALIFAAAASGSLGRTHYVNGKFVSSDLCFIITPKDQENLPVDLKFYHILFNELKDEIVRNTKAGTSKEAIGLGSFGKYKLPYFDIETQIEIKNRFVNSEETKSNLANELNQQIGLIKKLRQQLLQDAVQGKLVPQNPSDGNATDLLRKIKAEKEKLIAEKKLKKEKELPSIKAEEIPFDIPENWVWCRLGEIAYIACGSTPKQDAFVSSGIPYLKMYNLKNQKIDFDYKPQYIKEEIHNGQLKRSRTEIGDVIMNIVGPPLGKLAIIPESLPQANFNQAGVLIRPYLVKEINKWIYFYLNEMSEINSITTKGVAGQDNISITQSNNIKIPLPPPAEQNRIVKKLEKLMQHCNDLEASIKQSEMQNEKLLQQVLREALKMSEPQM